jgi:hypothetical protein
MRKPSMVSTSLRLGRRPEVVDHQSADGIEMLVGKFRGERRVEVGDLGQRLDPVTAGVVPDDVVLGLVEVVLVLDVADDLFQHVLDGDQTGDAAVFVDHDRHVVARRPEFSQQNVQALRFGNEDRRAQRVAQVEFLAGEIAQQILGEQDAEHVVLAFADRRKARVRRFQYDLGDLFRRFLDVDHVHLGARHHDVAHRHVGHRQRAFDDGQCVGIHQVALEGAMEQFQELFAVLGFAQQQRGQAFYQAGFTGWVHCQA